MFRKIVVPALVALGLLGSSLAPLSAYAQKPTPAPKSDKMGSDKKTTKKKSDKKGPERGPDGKFLSKKKKSDKKEGDKMAGDKPKTDATPKPKKKKSDKKDDKMGATTGTGKMDATPKPKRKKSDKMSSDKTEATPRPERKKKSEKKESGKMVANPTGEKPVWDAGVKRWRLNGRFIKEADALKMGGKK